MSDRITQHIPQDRFWPLPDVAGRAGAARRVGVEIEFSGLHEAQAAEVVQRIWGGAVCTESAHDLVVRGTLAGDVRVELDTALKRYTAAPFGDLALELSRSVVPVEIVLPPLDQAWLGEVGRLLEALRDAGAQGSREGALYAFGLHLNVELAGAGVEHVVPVSRAYALLEDWLRLVDPLDPMRRVLPFVDPHPRAYVDEIAAFSSFEDLETFARCYLHHNPTRNRGLDLLPLLTYFLPELVQEVLGEMDRKGRPAWHYRLPETDLQAPGGGLHRIWNIWCLVERVAARPGLVDQLAADWRAHRASMSTTPWDWPRVVTRALLPARIWQG